MGLYDEYEDKEQHNYLCGKNGGKIIFKNWKKINFKYGLNENNIPSIGIYNIEENEDFLSLLESKEFNIYWSNLLLFQTKVDYDFVFYFNNDDEDIKIINELTKNKKIKIYIFNTKDDCINEKLLDINWL